jgi:hypothetical protein
LGQEEPTRKETEAIKKFEKKKRGKKERLNLFH